MHHLRLLCVVLSYYGYIVPISGGYLPPEDLPTPQEQIEELRQIVDGLAKHQKIQDAEIAELKRQNSDLKSAVSTLRDASNGVSSRRIRHAETLGVAFSVALTHHLVNLSRGQNIAFDNVITDINNSYDVATGIFTAPLTGLYVFGVTLLSYNSHNSLFHLRKNGQIVYPIYVGGLGGHSYDTSGSMVVVSLQPGDMVSVQNWDPNEALWGDGFSTFSGFLLKTEY
ncbi:complement C1q tumor necrosis factor-related protein 3-like [Dreissena polymorpha]|uniref:C1q domain-containing protein n=1 Tax=Dreissena polymorpha TaxID=45954 RepID=A0A9D4QWS4_DREPO|nr:complement C1q tumor necrosis factor-related protein 3-like [Dreissena polymorpha]KAH3846541.1 hypothetical protein DPMN_088843 [Dreissena polymorpha]